MSSTTSSDCESCDCSQCTFSFECNYNQYGQCMNSRHAPIYTSMAHPLIYYAQVQPTNRRQNSDRPKKDNPFMKAFKWYTQERKAVCGGENEVAPQRSGFANWLDNKYCEYMRDSGQQPTSNEPRARKTKTCECPKPTKTYRRFKTPWPKRTRTANDSGDVPQKYPDGSCEYILKPKESSRAVSENCFHVGKSNATVVSSHMPCNKCSRRSQSLSDVSPEKYVYNKHVETVPLTVHECKCTYISCECPQQQIEYPPLKDQPETPCTCQKEKVPEPVKVKYKEQESRNQPKTPCTCQNEEVPAIVKEPSKEQGLRNQPEPPCTCQNEKVPAIVKEASKGQYSINQPVPPCTCSRERVPIALKSPSCHEEAPQVLEVQQEKIPEVVRVLSYQKEALQVVEVQQEKMPEIVRVPSKAQESKNDLCCKCEKKSVPKVVQVPSDDLSNLLGHCCSCHKKVPEIVQVPSQCRAVEGSCQCTEKKVVSVCEETQYKTALIVPLRSAQYHGPCCCNTCKPAAPPSPQPLLQPQIFCLPVKVQDRKISTPDICVAPSVQCVSPKKQKKVKQCITIATQCGEGNQSKVSSQCQHEICECGKNNSSSFNCYEERQVFDPIPIKRESYSTVAVNKDTGEYSIMKEVAVVNKLTRCLTCASNGAVQTSDHSIRFENDGCCSCPYPLFFKIVYTDVE